MTSSKQVDLGVRRNNPKPVIFPLEAVDSRALIQIPDTNGLVLARRNDQILVGVKQTSARVLEVASAGINLPLNTELVYFPPMTPLFFRGTYGLGFTHAPQLDEAVVARGDDQRHRRMESNPVDTPVMALEDKLDNGISVSKHVGLVGVLPSHLVLEAHGGRCGVLLAQAGNCHARC